MKKVIRFEGINKEFSEFAGLKFFDSLFTKICSESFFKAILPNYRGIKSKSQKIKSLIHSFLCGADCLSDLDYLRDDIVFSELTGDGIASTTAGDFLRSFRKGDIETLQDSLMDQAFKLRGLKNPNYRDFTLTMDSTPHPQFGKKMEGVAYNYKSNWCLDSQNAYDEYGFHYAHEVRPGSTYSGNGAEPLIRKIFKKVPPNVRRFFRADSAFGRLTVYNELINANVKFAIVLKKNIYENILDLNLNTINWKKEKFKFFDRDECEMADAFYPLKGLAGGLSHLRVIFVRVPLPENLAKKENLEDIIYNGYRYYALVTNIWQHEQHMKKIIFFYRKRANVENFIREIKNGLDLKHYPCKKINANKAYGIFGAMAYNLQRFASFFINPKGGCFSKKVRNTLIRIPGQVVRHARSLTIKINYRIKEVLDKFEQFFNFSRVFFDST